MCKTSQLGQVLVKFGKPASSFLFQNPAPLFWVCLSMSHTGPGALTFRERFIEFILTKLWSEKEPIDLHSDVITEWCVTLFRDICIQKELRF